MRTVTLSVKGLNFAAEVSPGVQGGIIGIRCVTDMGGQGRHKLTSSRHSQHSLQEVLGTTAPLRRRL